MSSAAITSALATSPAQDAASSKTPLRMRHPDYTQPGSAPDSESSDDNDYHESDGEGETTAVEGADNYVRKVLAKERPLPPITLKNWYKEINVISTLALTIVPALAFYGALTTKVQLKTAIWAVVYYFYTGLGITAGYHRLWAHRSYTASLPLQYFLALGGSGAVEGSIKWWSRGHRAHHRYCDTELDPYSAHKGLLWSHVGWMIVKPRRKPGVADVSDLSKNEVVKWQHRWYLPLIIGMGFVFPTVVAGLFWGDWRGGFFFAGAARLLFVHHSTFCVNSLAHWLGETPFDDKHTPRDHVLTALVTIGEGYHNFHHEFPQDFRNAIKWYQYDPTKWFIFTAYSLGLASQLKVFPDNEIKKGQFAMKLKSLQESSKQIVWPTDSNDLPVLTWDEFQQASKERPLMVVSGYIHDVSTFMDDHPGGRHFIKARVGKDATSAFYGGVYDHSNGAGNILAALRVGCIEGGYEIESLKKYSEVITSLNESGAAGVGGKQADLTSGPARKTVQITGNPGNKGKSLVEPEYVPKFSGTQLCAGL
ncbi:putative stearoyl-CoA 9-desaturase [Meredithblackwellia eburnea MCA 4105]